MSDWRERWEEKDNRGNTILDVWEKGGEVLAHLWQLPGRNATVVETGDCGLIPKKKPPTYRPYKRGEVKCGDVFQRKDNGCQQLVTAVSNNHEDTCCLNGWAQDSSLSWLTFSQLLSDYTYLDGTPAGVAE